MTTPKRAFGRSLKDFWLDGEEGRLHPGEQQLMAACAKGELCHLRLLRPRLSAPDRYVRAGFVRFLALGGDAEAPVHEAGVRLKGAWIDGALDLSAAEVPHRLGLARCRIEQLTARDARLRGLHLNGSCLEAGLGGDGIKVTGDVFLRDGFRADGAVRLPGAEIGGVLDCGGGSFENAEGNALHCDSARVAGGVFLRNGFRAGGEVRLLGAEIGGVLDCSGGSFENAEGNALSCDGARVAGSVFLSGGFRASGEVRLLGAEIGGVLDCSGGRLENAGGDALSCDRARVTGNVFLRDGFRAGGAVRLLGAEIGGDLACSGGSFENAEGNALSCDGATVKGRFFFRTVSKLEGAVHLSSFHVGTLLDDPASWKGARGKLILDGFTYGRIDGAPAFTGADGRIAWLKSQRADQLGKEFRPQPWEQLVKVLREMGHPNEARKVAIAKQQALRDANRFPPWERRFHWVHGQLTSYGYRPLRLFKWLSGFLLGATVLFTFAVRPYDLRWHGNGAYWITPAAARPNIDCIAALPANATTDDQKNCPPKPPAMNEFFAPAYALDALLPVINLGYRAEWRPNRTAADGDPLIGGWAVQGALWFLTLFGWVAGALIAVAVAGLVRKD